MLELIRKVEGAGPAAKTVSLAWEKRLKSRLRVQLDDGEEAGIFLARGTVLRGGDILATATGELVRVVAAPELVSTVRTDEPLLLARLCYHLGNRHVALEIMAGSIRYLHDHVLDDMVAQLGGRVVVETGPFEPEHGAYAGPGHSHGTHSHE